MAWAKTMTIEKFYTCPIKYNGKTVGEATFYKDRLPKSKDFYFVKSCQCKGDFEKDKVKEYQILELNLIKQ